MNESNKNQMPEDWMEDLSTDTRVKGYDRDEMIACAKCARVNPPNRLDCIYCGVTLEISPEQQRNLKPLLRNADAWKNASNIILVASPEKRIDEDLQEVARMLRMDVTDLEKIFAVGTPLPLARSEQETEIGIVVKRLTELGLEINVLPDSVFNLSAPTRRLRTIGFSEDSLSLTLFNDGMVKKIDRSEISHIVVGVLFENRVESTEKQQRNKEENKILETAEISDDQLITDIFTTDDPIGYRMTAKGFDFSFLGGEKSMLVNENMRTAVTKLRAFAPDAHFDDDYLSVRGYLSHIWAVDEHTDSKGLKRSGFGGYNREMVTTSNNNEQFTKYSRLQRHLK